MNNYFVGERERVKSIFKATQENVKTIEQVSYRKDKSFFTTTAIGKPITDDFVDVDPSIL